MKQAVADKWVKALNSGKYAQTEGKLCNRGNKYDSFCCLGVLTDLYIQDRHKNTQLGKYNYGWESKKGEGRTLFFGHEESNLPIEVTEWAGMKSTSGLMKRGKVFKVLVTLKDKWGDDIQYDNLIDMNDSGRNFKEIAKVIKQNWRYL